MFAVLIAIGLVIFLYQRGLSTELEGLLEEQMSFSVSEEVAPSIESWSKYSNNTYGYTLTYPSSWELNHSPGFELEDVGNPAELSIGNITIDVYASDYDSGLSNCDEVSCEYFYYGYGEQIDSGYKTILDEPAVWELRTRAGHTYYNIVFKKFNNIYSLSFLHASSNDLSFDQMRDTYNAVIALFEVYL